MRLSIVIAAHNEGESLWKTVQSCVETCAGLDHEIVIADDASWDGSMQDVLDRFLQVRVVRFDERRGPSPTKDLGARHARGDAQTAFDEVGEVRRCGWGDRGTRFLLCAAIGRSCNGLPLPVCTSG